tara:strand:- start:930 stop:1499 length:570 start_codon:yes stop_codon:yes gene_type:complete
MRTMFQNELFEPEESALVWHLLPKLHGSGPRILSLATLTHAALLVAKDVLNYKRLLQYGRCDHLLLYGHFKLNASRVGFGPDEGSINEPHACEAARFSQEQREQLFGLGLDLCPGAVTPLEAIATTASALLNLFGDTLADVVLTLQTVHTQVDRIWPDSYRAHAAEDPLLLFHLHIYYASWTAQIRSSL